MSGEVIGADQRPSRERRTRVARRRLLASGAAWAALALGGCARNRSQPVQFPKAQPAPVSRTVQGERVELNLTGWPYRQDLLEVSLERFRLQHPNVGVQFHEVLNDYRIRLDQMLGSTSSPDVVLVREGQAGSWWSNRLIRPLQDIQTFSELAGRLRPAARAGVGPAAALAGLPFYTDVMVLAYDESMLAKVGGRPPETWDELRGMAREMRERKISNAPLTLNLALKVNANLPWWAMVYAAGGSLLGQGETRMDADHPAVRLLVTLREFLTQDLILDPETMETTYEPIEQGGHAFAVVGTYMAKRFAEARTKRSAPTLRLAPVPGLDSPGIGTASWTPFYAVSSGSPNPEAAELLTLHLGGIDGEGAFYSPEFWAVQDGLPPAYPEVSAMPQVRKAAANWIDVDFHERVLAMGRPPEGMWEAWFETWEHWSQEELIRALWGGVTPLESIQSMVRSAFALRNQSRTGP